MARRPETTTSNSAPQVRVRENAESIAFYSGDQRESELAGARLARTVRTIFGKARRGRANGSRAQHEDRLSN